MSERSNMARGERGRAPPTTTGDQKADRDLGSNSPPPPTHATAASMRHRQAYSASSDTTSSFFNDALTSDPSRSGFESSAAAQQQTFSSHSQVDASISEGRSQSALSKDGVKTSLIDGASRFDGSQQLASDHGGASLHSEAVASSPFSRESSYLSNAASDLDVPQYQHASPHPYLRNHSAFQSPFLSAPQMERGRNSTSDFSAAPASNATGAYRYQDSNPALPSRAPAPVSGTAASTSASVHFANDSFSYASRSPFAPTSISMAANPFFHPSSFQGSPFPTQGPYAAAAAPFSGAHFRSFPPASSSYASTPSFSPQSQFSSTLPIQANSMLANAAPSGHSLNAASASLGAHHVGSMGYAWPPRFEESAGNAGDEEKLNSEERRYSYGLSTSEDLGAHAPPIKRPFSASSDELYHQSAASTSPHSSSLGKDIKPVIADGVSAGRRGGRGVLAQPLATNEKAAREPSTPPLLPANAVDGSSSDKVASSGLGRAAKGKRSAATASAASDANANKKRSQSSSNASSAATPSPSLSSSSNASTPTIASRPQASVGSAPAPSTSSSSPEVIAASLPNLGPLGADPEARAAVVNAIATIRRSFESANVLINGARAGVLTLPHESSHLRVETQPQEYQVKDFNILPTLVVKVSHPSDARSCDHVAAFLYCDESLNLEDAFFLAALNARHAPNGELHFNNLRISKEMLQGRTKGFSFVIGFSYVTAKGETVDTVYTTPFWLFSNVNQEGFPKAARDSILRPQWRDSSGNFASQKRKR